MKDGVLGQIANSSIYGVDEVEKVFDIYQSYDRVIEACEYGVAHGYGSLMQAAKDCRQAKEFPGIEDFFSG